MTKKEKKAKPFIIIFVAIALLFGLSFVPWSKLTNGFLSDFNLFSDIIGNNDTTAVVADNSTVDPALAEALKNEKKTPSCVADSDSVPVIIDEKAPRLNGYMIIEDYTPDQAGMVNFKKALVQRNKRPVRIAFLGDSYIEGDIITQQLRHLMQKQFGGNGVGYMPAQSEVAGFRLSVRHQQSGWDAHEIGESSKSKYFILPGRHHTAPSAASITYRGVDKPNLQGWNTSEVVFVAPASGGVITLTGDSIQETFHIAASPDVQSVKLKGYTTSLKVSCSVPGLVMLGTWLNDSTGVTVDNMSVRGDSGISRRSLNTALAQDMAQFIDYDVIVLEYGINALTASQKNYEQYSKIMGEVIERVKECYPNADIVLLGIGDRGYKQGGQVVSMPTAPNMVAAQRETARQHGVHFWDIREAMGGDGAILKWRDNKLVNADYIHLNFKGGDKVGTMFYNSLTRAINTTKIPSPKK